MRKQTKTYNALVISLILHVILLVWGSFYIAENFENFEDPLPVVLLDAERLPEPKVRKPHLLPQFEPPTPRARQSVERSGKTPEHIVEFSELTPAAPIRNNRVVSPKAPIKSDSVPDFVTHADVPVPPELAVPDTSLGDAASAASPSQSGTRRGKGAVGEGTGKLEHQGNGGSKRFADFSTDSPPVDVTPLTEFTEVPEGLGLFETRVMPGHGLVGDVYVPGGRILSMPYFDLIEPIYTFLAAKLDLPEVAYTQGFPTPSSLRVVEDFAIRFRGQIFIKTTGRHYFALNSDDGSQLLIDGRLIVNNDGVHQTTYRRGSIALTRGLHKVEIRYFQGPRYHIALQWFHKPPNQSEQLVPPEVIYRPGQPQTVRRKRLGTLTLPEL